MTLYTPSGNKPIIALSKTKYFIIIIVFQVTSYIFCLNVTQLKKSVKKRKNTKNISSKQIFNCKIFQKAYNMLRQCSYPQWYK